MFRMLPIQFDIGFNDTSLFGCPATSFVHPCLLTSHIVIHQLSKQLIQPVQSSTKLQTIIIAPG